MSQKLFAMLRASVSVRLRAIPLPTTPGPQGKEDKRREAL